MTKEYYGKRKLIADKELLSDSLRFLSDDKQRNFLVQTPEKKIEINMIGNCVQIYNLNNKLESNTSNIFSIRNEFCEQLRKYPQCFKQVFDIEKEKTLNQTNAMLKTIYSILKNYDIKFEEYFITSLTEVSTSCYAVHNILTQYFDVQIRHFNLGIARVNLEFTKYNDQIEAILDKDGVKLKSPLVLLKYLNFLLYFDYHKERFNKIQEEMKIIFEKGSKFNLGGVR